MAALPRRQNCGCCVLVVVSCVAAGRVDGCDELESTVGSTPARVTCTVPCCAAVRGHYSGRTLVVGAVDLATIICSWWGVGRCTSLVPHSPDSSFQRWGGKTSQATIQLEPDTAIMLMLESKPSSRSIGRSQDNQARNFETSADKAAPKCKCREHRSPISKGCGPSTEYRQTRLFLVRQRVLLPHSPDAPAELWTWQIRGLPRHGPAPYSGTPNMLHNGCPDLTLRIHGTTPTSPAGTVLQMTILPFRARHDVHVQGWGPCYVLQPQ